MNPTVEDVLAVVGPFWDLEMKPLLKPAACIAACRTLAGVFDYFGITYSVVPVGITIANDRAFEHMGITTPEDFPTAAWNIGIDPSGEGSGWGGHLVIVTADEPATFIDLDARQFDRPNKGIATGGPVVRAWDTFERVERSTEGLERYGFSMLHTPLPRGHYLWLPDLDNTAYLQSKDWTKPYDAVIGESIRRLKGRAPRQVVDPR